MTYLPIHIHTMWSLLDSSIACDKLAKKAKEYNLPAVCLTDHMSLKGVVSFFQSMTKEKIKPIIGCELDIIDGQETYRLTVLAKNKEGYRNLVKLVSRANDKTIYEKFGKALITWENLTQNRLGLIALIGDLKSELSYSLFENWEQAYKANSIEVCKSLIDKNWEIKWESIIEKYKKIFKDDLHIFYDCSSLPILEVLKESIKQFCEQRSYVCFPSNNVHYLNDEDEKLHKMVIQASLEVSKTEVDKLENHSDYRIFFTEKSYGHLLKNITETGEENNTLTLLNSIEDYSIQERPILPQFKIGQHLIQDANQMLYDLCKKGFIDTGLANELRHNKELKEIYGERIRKELRIFRDAGIASYFLIVADIVNFAKKCGIPVDIRGSSTGCMASYLLGISSVDPLRPDPVLGYDPDKELPFERFYNEGRNTADNISLPDIDIDVPPTFRETLMKYIKGKYGNECVGHIITHSRFKGRGAIKEVFKLLGIPFEIANEINKQMIDEAKISDELAEYQLEDPNYGIIQWNIDNVKEISNFNDTYPEAFEIAIGLEKIPKNPSVHAAGIIIADQPLSNLFPIVFNEKEGEQIVAIEGADIEFIGGTKFDILGVAALEKVHQIQQMVNKKLTESPYGINQDFSRILHESIR